MKKTASNNTEFVHRRAILGTGAALVIYSLGGRAWAQADYPSRPITVIVPYAPGGQGDVFARLIGNRLSRVLNQPVIVDNRPGATGALGSRMVAKSKGDLHLATRADWRNRSERLGHEKSRLRPAQGL